LITQLEFTNEEAADVAEVSVAFTKKIRASLEKE
jgi:hypothetical protein